MVVYMLDYCMIKCCFCHLQRLVDTNLGIQVILNNTPDTLQLNATIFIATNEKDKRLL